MILIISVKRILHFLHRTEVYGICEYSKEERPMRKVGDKRDNRDKRTGIKGWEYSKV